jgi:hypothetical protein
MNPLRLLLPKKTSDSIKYRAEDLDWSVLILLLKVLQQKDIAINSLSGLRKSPFVCKIEKQ